MENWKEQFDAKFTTPIENQEASWFGEIVTKPFINGFWKVTRPYLLAFISSLLQEQRQRIAKEIEKAKREDPFYKKYETDALEGDAFENRLFDLGLQAALNIVLGEDNN